MKHHFLTLFMGCFFLFPTIQAQTEKGKTLVAISSALGIGGNANGFAFSSNKTKSDNFNSDPVKVTSFNLSPRVGYFVANNFALGAEVFYGYSRQDEFLFQGDILFDEVKTSTIGAGPFARYYIKAKNLTPFLEAGVVFGRATSEISDFSDSEFNLFNFGGGAGIAIPLGQKVSFDALLGYTHFETKQKEDNPNNVRNITNNFSLNLGFTMYLGQGKAAQTSSD